MDISQDMSCWWDGDGGEVEVEVEGVVVGVTGFCSVFVDIKKECEMGFVGVLLGLNCQDVRRCRVVLCVEKSDGGKRRRRLEGMCVGVTGATGFIGRELVRELQDEVSDEKREGLGGLEGRKGVCVCMNVVCDEDIDKFSVCVDSRNGQGAEEIVVLARNLNKARESFPQRRFPSVQFVQYDASSRTDNDKTSETKPIPTLEDTIANCHAIVNLAGESISEGPSSFLLPPSPSPTSATPQNPSSGLQFTTSPETEKKTKNPSLAPPLGRWSENRKREIRDSRVLGTRKIVNAITNVQTKKTDPDRQRSIKLISASAVGYYGPSQTSTFTEQSPPGRFSSLIPRPHKR